MSFLDGNCIREILKYMDYKTLCLIKTVCKEFKNIANDMDLYVFESTIYNPFFIYKTTVYDFILTNMMFLTMKDNANIFYYFLKNVYKSYKIIFFKDKEFVSSCFSFMVLFYPFLEKGSEYKILCTKLGKYMMIRQNDFEHMDKNVAYDYLNLKYDNLISEDQIKKLRQFEIKHLLCY